MKKFLALLFLSSGLTAQAGHMVVSSEDGTLNVRQTASAKAKVVATIKDGDSVELLENGSEWDIIKLEDGTTGYVKAKYLVNPPQPQLTGGVEEPASTPAETSSPPQLTGGPEEPVEDGSPEAHARVIARPVELMFAGSYRGKGNSKLTIEIQWATAGNGFVVTFTLGSSTFVSDYNSFDVTDSTHAPDFDESKALLTCPEVITDWENKTASTRCTLQVQKINQGVSIKGGTGDWKALNGKWTKE